LAAHTYWRFLFLESALGENAQLRVYEAQMRLAPAGVDQLTGGTATASTGASPGNVSDDNATTYWSPTTNVAPTTPAWWRYQFAVAKDIVEFTLTAGVGFQTYAPRRFALEWSDDGTAWTQAAYVAGLTWASGETKTFALSASPEYRAAQIATEVLFDQSAQTRIAQLVAEVFASPQPQARVGQVVLEVLRAIDIGDTYNETAAITAEAIVGKAVVGRRKKIHTHSVLVDDNDALSAFGTVALVAGANVNINDGNDVLIAAANSYAPPRNADVNVNDGNDVLSAAANSYAPRNANVNINDGNDVLQAVGGATVARVANANILDGDDALYARASVVSAQPPSHGHSSETVRTKVPRKPKPFTYTYQGAEPSRRIEASLTSTLDGVTCEAYATVGLQERAQAQRRGAIAALIT